MSDAFSTAYPDPPLMPPVRARNLARRYKGFAETLRYEGYAREADLADRDAQWWLTYAISLSQTPPGAIE